MMTEDKKYGIYKKNGSRNFLPHVTLYLIFLKFRKNLSSVLFNLIKSNQSLSVDLKKN